MSNYSIYQMTSILHNYVGIMDTLWIRKRLKILAYLPQEIAPFDWVLDVAKLPNGGQYTRNILNSLCNYKNVTAQEELHTMEWVTFICKKLDDLTHFSGNTQEKINLFIIYQEICAYITDVRMNEDVVVYGKTIANIIKLCGNDYNVSYNLLVDLYNGEVFKTRDAASINYVSPDILCTHISFYLENDQDGVKLATKLILEAIDGCEELYEALINGIEISRAPGMTRKTTIHPKINHTFNCFKAYNDLIYHQFYTFLYKYVLQNPTYFTDFRMHHISNILQNSDISEEEYLISLFKPYLTGEPND